MAEIMENGTFEADAATTNPPTSWSNFNSPANVQRQVATDEVHGGSKSWKVNTTDGNTADCGLQQTEFTRSGGVITLAQNTDYHFECYIKTALTTGQAHVHIKTFESGYANEGGIDTSQITGTTDWTLNEVDFNSGDAVIAEIWLCFGAYGAAANGSAWFDDVSLDVAGGAAVVKDPIGPGMVAFAR